MFFEFLCFKLIFSVFKKLRFWCILGPPRNHASQWIRDLWLKGVSLLWHISRHFWGFAFCMIFFFSVFQKKIRVLCYRCYNPHRSRNALSPVCGILKKIKLGYCYILIFGTFKFLWRLSFSDIHFGNILVQVKFQLW